MEVFKRFLNAYIKKFFGFLFPGELLVLILGTAICYSTNLNTKNDVHVVGEIPIG